jgi:hypothetical protein
MTLLTARSKPEDPSVTSTALITETTKIVAPVYSHLKAQRQIPVMHPVVDNGVIALGFEGKEIERQQHPPQGFRGLRAASRVPITTPGTTTSTVNSHSIGPRDPGRWARRSSGTVARPAPSVSTPSATAATSAVCRARRIVLTAISPASDWPSMSQP